MKVLKLYSSVSRPGEHSQPVFDSILEDFCRPTDRQTDRQTDVAVYIEYGMDMDEPFNLLQQKPERYKNRSVVFRYMASSFLPLEIEWPIESYSFLR